MATSYSPFSLDSSALYFNPCSVGVWSATLAEAIENSHKGRLNPYSTGIWSATKSKVLT